jgi:prolyl-tRNA editing enzyme YbaK/EbsC (Cys-tRNA(Pro) deacylase)
MISLSIESARAHLEKWGRSADILEFDASTATVALAAQALGVEEARIAKSICLLHGEQALIIVAAGDARIDNRKFKDTFGFKARMLSPEQTEAMTGHAVGGVCPFGLPDGVSVYLDQSLARFDTVFPACGNSNSAIELTLDELETYSGSLGWVDIGKQAAE